MPATNWIEPFGSDALAGVSRMDCTVPEGSLQATKIAAPLPCAAPVGLHVADPGRPSALKSYTCSSAPVLGSSSITPPAPVLLNCGTATKKVLVAVLNTVASTPLPLTFG